MKRKICFITILSILLLLAGCSNPSSDEGSDKNTVLPSSDESADSDPSQMFTERDFETDYDKATAVLITLNGNSAECSSDAVNITDSTVTIQEEGTYVLSGTLDNGMIVVQGNNKDEIQLVLDGVSIHNDTSAAIYVAQADKVFITLAADSQNSLSSGGEFIAVDDSNIDAAVFSKDDLTFNGEGALTVSSPTGHGLLSKDDLVITGGVYDITSEKRGIDGKESVRIADGTFTITAGRDGIHAENADDATLGFLYLSGGNYNISADGDGISASNTMQIEDGNYNIKTGGGSESITHDSNGNWGWDRQSNDTAENSASTKGIKATENLMINGGTFSINSADDALHSNADLTVNGGRLNISTGDDGLHADQTTTITAGSITITDAYEGIEGQNITISGGSIDLTSDDDGLNAAGGNDGSGDKGFGGFEQGGFDAASDCTITISGGTIHINASGDGVDSNGNLTVTGGETYVSGPVNDGNGALDYNGEATISGGIFIAEGSSGMAQNFSTSSTQGAMLVSVSGTANTVITLKDDSGKELLSRTADKDFTCVIISSPDIKQGATYTVTAGSSTAEVTMDSLIYGSVGIGGAPGGMGGAPGGMGGRPAGDMNGKPGGGRGERPGDMGDRPEDMSEKPNMSTP